MRDFHASADPTVRTHCRFCAIANQPHGRDSHDEPFLESENYFAIASIGALVDGWTLVCTKAHKLNASSAYRDAEFLEFVRASAQLVRDRYSARPIVFEHGVDCAGSPTGCGTDHAHVHVVPFGDSIEREIRASGEEWSSVSLTDVEAASQDGEYLLYCGNILDSNPSALIRVLSRPVSQYFRKVIAKIVGREADSNYREFPFFERASATASVLKRDGRRLLGTSP